MEKEKCNHKLTLPLYARGENNWVSSLKLTGKMVYVCTKCGVVLEKDLIKKDVVYTTDEGDKK